MKLVFHVFYLRPDAHSKVLLGGLLRSGSFLLSVFFVIGWMYFLEHETFFDKFYLILVLCAFFAAVSIIVGVRHYKSGINFRLFSNEDGFEFTTPGAQVKINYTDITRVERTPDNTLLIYTQSSSTKPVVMISDKITDREVLEKILSRFVPITDGKGRPILFGTTAQLLISGLFILTVLLHLFSRNAVTVVASGSVVIALLVYTGVIMYIFQKEVKNVRALIALILLIAVVMIRIVMFLAT